VSVFNLAVIVGALGYFVDIYDIVLFSILRVPSLRGLGVSEAEILNTGVWLLDLQMLGLLAGGVVWGIIGDKRGRLSVLLGSILLYSVANLANAFIHDVHWYGVLRFIAGFGLAGELGAAITLVAETLTKERRGYGTMLVAAVGLSGATVAGLVGGHMPWRTAYIVGGSLGLLLLLARIKLAESGLYLETRTSEVSRGNWFLIFRSPERLFRYLRCIAIGIPIWYTVGVLITFSPEIGASLGVKGEILVGDAIFYHYLGASIGDFSFGCLSQLLKSRKAAVFSSLMTLSGLIFIFLFHRGISVERFYLYSFLLGIGTGYWAVFVTIAAEQFGTNLRATVATSVPNFVRGSVVPVTLLFRGLNPILGISQSALMVGCACLGLAFFSLARMGESYGEDLNFLET
jgi:MFS family permease